MSGRPAQSLLMKGGEDWFRIKHHQKSLSLNIVKKKVKPEISVSPRRILRTKRASAWTAESQ